MLDILSNKEIIKLVDSSEEGVDENDPQTLIYKNIFPYLRIPSTQTKAMTNILIAVDKVGNLKRNPTFCSVRVTIWVLAHQEHMQVKNKNGNRIDLISDEIEKLFYGSSKYGFSKLKNFPSVEKLLGDKFIYREIIFATDERSSPYCAIGR